MAQANSPLHRSIGLTGVLRWLLAVAAAIAMEPAWS
jgi:hypothetical protein